LYSSLSQIASRCAVRRGQLQHITAFIDLSGGAVSEDQWRGGAMEYDKDQPSALAPAHDAGFPGMAIGQAGIACVPEPALLPTVSG
jgi:hypothetical protein